MLQKVHCLCKLVSQVVFPENMGPIDNSKYPGIEVLSVGMSVSKMGSTFYSSIFTLINLN
jgi:hypothetical protein